MPREWHIRTARSSCRQRLENRFLAIALPHLPAHRLSAMMHLPGETRERLDRIFGGRRPTLLAIPQIGAWELATALPLVCPRGKGGLAIPYARIAKGKLEEWFRRGRERFGVRILEPDEGFIEGLSILHRGGVYGIHFDQHHPSRGIRTPLLNRLTTVSELPGLLVERFEAQLVGLYTERISFWHYAMRIKDIESGAMARTITMGLNRWLENLIRTNDSACGSWPWDQDRWNTDNLPGQALSLDQKSIITLPGQGLTRSRRLWVRLPDHLAPALRTIPLLRALRQSRPDSSITVLARRPLLDLFRPSGLFESEIALPKHGLNVHQLVDLQLKYPDVFLTLTETPRSDLEAWLIGCSLRFGISRPGLHRPLLTHTWEVPEDLDERTLHETRFLHRFLACFGLDAEPDYSPVKLASALPSARLSSLPGEVIGLLGDTDGESAGRWPAEKWRELIQFLIRNQPDLHILFLGSARDRVFFDALVDSLAKDRFTNLAGEMDLAEFAGTLTVCDLVIGTESEGLHLANASGIPVIGLFGPGNPIQSGPAFEAPCRILLPPGCRPTGGSPTPGIRPSTVIEAVERHLGRMQGRSTRMSGAGTIAVS